MSVPVDPWSVWWIELDPVEGREQAGRRPAIVVSSRFHLQVTGGALLSVLPLTTRHRPGWHHHVEITIPSKPASYVLTEQLRTISSSRLSGNRPMWPKLSPGDIATVRAVLGKMLDLQ